MGIYDRDYARQDNQGFNLAGISWSGVGIVVAVNVAVYLLDMLSGWEIQNFAALHMRHAELIHHPWNFWQLFTYGWLHSDRDISHIIFNMIGVWFFGRYAENVLGRKRFLQFYCSSIILAGVGDVLTQLTWFPLHQEQHNSLGASGGVMALVAYAAWLVPNRRIYIYGLLPVPMWLLATFYILMDFSGYASPKDNVDHAAHLAGALAGTLFYHTHWCLTDLWPSKLLPDISRYIKIRRSKLKMHHPPDTEEEDPSVSPLSMSARVDAILEKMSRVGEEGLTQEERDYLANASRKLRARKGK